MVIDAQALEHLDILPPVNTKQDQSLFTYLSQGVRTPFGKRLLKRWVVSPLTDCSLIKQRQDCVSDLVANPELRNDIQNYSKKLPDVERILTRIYTYSVKSKVKAFYVDQQVLNRLDEFNQLLETFRDMAKWMDDLFDKYPIKSKRLI